MTDLSLHSRVVKPAVLMEATFGLSQAPKPLEEEEISRFIDKNSRYARAALNLGTEIEIIQESKQGYEINPEIEEEVRKSPPDQRFAILNKYVQRYEPFTAFLSFLTKGYSSDRAAVQVDVLYDLGMSEEKLERQFVNLGVYTNLLEKTNEDVTVNVEENPLTDEYIQDLEIALKSEAAARVFLEDRIGEDIIAYMNDEDIEELVTALLEHRSNPRNAISAAGRAVEDFQREIGDDHGIEGNYSGASGIGQLADELHRESWSMKRQLHGGKYLGGMRNPSGGHGYNPETLERWEVNPEVALDYILASIHYIRSLYRISVDNRQVL
ncbi:MAG: hypothetical protein ABEJ83_02610 [Candidatus Nanohaloarchaea archaeon]